MHTKVGKKYLLIPLLYIGIITSLVYLQFNGEKSFTEVISGILVEGTLPSGGADRKRDISRLNLQFGDLRFTFNPDNPIKLYWGGEGPGEDIYVRGYEEMDDGVLIYFTRDFTLLFKTEQEKSVLITPSLSGEEEKPFTIEIPLSLKEDVRVEHRGRIPVYLFEGENEFSYLTLSLGDSVGDDTEKLVFTRKNENFVSAEYKWGSVERIDPYAYWFTDVAFFTSQEEYNQRVESLVEAMYEGISGPRFDRYYGVWENGEGKSGFSEEAAVTLLSEALERDRYGRYVGTVKDAARAHEESLTYFSNPFFGDLLGTTDTLLQKKRRELETIRTFLNEKSLEVFTLPELMPTVFLYGSPEEVTAFVEFARTVRPEEASLPAAIGMYSALKDAEKLDPGLAERLSHFASIPEQILFPGIVKTENGLFLNGSGGNVNVADSLEAGLQIKSYGEEKGAPIIAKIGRTMIGSLFRLTREHGFLPLILHLNETGDTVVSMEGTISPESLYAKFEENPYYPRYVFCAEAGEKTRLWRTAKIEELRCTEEEIEIKFRFPAWGIHNVVVHDIPSVESIEMHGLMWNEDRNFQSYSDGWFFDEDENILYVKIQHRRDLDSLLIRM